MYSLFHFAFHVNDLDTSRAFYRDVLGCTEGRSAETWVDFNFFGHQLSLHLGAPFITTRTGSVGEHRVMMPHFGVVLSTADWLNLVERLKTKDVQFDISPVTRFKNEPGQQYTLFFFDPSGNPIEIKGFDSFDDVFLF
ncbi:VOC family protein [Serratia marcescens]|uniref:VOC family protein n=1 Tax=Serratia marcescens TaxID=615 RepID=UPI0032046D36